MDKKGIWHLKCSTQLPYEIAAHLQQFVGLLFAQVLIIIKLMWQQQQQQEKEQQVRQVPLAVEVQVQKWMQFIRIDTLAYWIWD